MGLVSPVRFIPLAEDIGFIIQLDEWVMKQSIKQFKKWHEDGLNPGVLSLNLSTLALERDEFIENIKDMILEENIDTSWLSFEVTESQIMKNPDKSIEKLKDLNNLGIKLSIDDFGTGYSSLSYLKKLPINKLKIDRSFIMDIPIDLDDIEITKTIISMARNLKLEVIAEGVETIEQRDFLLENGCNEIQGYIYYKPLPANDVEKEIKLFV
jgi:EAL domain-containing protein (putative c-di-GMP-specific phosphodiesterase class I)